MNVAYWTKAVSPPNDAGVPGDVWGRCIPDENDNHIFLRGKKEWEPLAKDALVKDPGPPHPFGDHTVLCFDPPERLMWAATTTSYQVRRRYVNTKPVEGIGNYAKMSCGEFARLRYKLSDATWEETLPTAPSYRTVIDAINDKRGPSVRKRASGFELEQIRKRARLTHVDEEPPKAPLKSSPLKSRIRRVSPEKSSPDPTDEMDVQESASPVDKPAPSSSEDVEELRKDASVLRLESQPTRTPEAAPEPASVPKTLPPPELLAQPSFTYPAVIAPSPATANPNLCMPPSGSIELPPNFAICTWWNGVRTALPFHYPDGKKVFTTGTADQYLATANDPNKCALLLERPMVQDGVTPWFIRRVSDDLRAWHVTNNIGHRYVQSLQPGVMRPQSDYQGPERIPADCVHASTWGAMSNAGYLIHPRHQSSGMVSWVTVASGVQFWTIFRPRWDDPDRTKAALRVIANATPRDNPEDLEHMFDIGTVMLTPGSVLILPPGAYHMVYTPVKSVTLGGNFLTIDSLHHTLMARQIEQYASFNTTNPYSAGVRRMLSRLAIAFTQMNGNSIPKRPLIALAHMLAYERYYFTTTQKSFVWTAPPPQIKTEPNATALPAPYADGSQTSPSGNSDSDDDEVLELLNEQRPPRPAPPSASYYGPPAPLTRHPPPFAWPLPPDVESDNDLVHAAFCAAETCVANNLPFPPAFEWPVPWHAPSDPRAMATIPPLPTHPKLAFQHGRYVMYRPALMRPIPVAPTPSVGRAGSAASTAAVGAASASTALRPASSSGLVIRLPPLASPSKPSALTAASTSASASQPEPKVDPAPPSVPSSTSASTSRAVGSAAVADAPTSSTATLASVLSAAVFPPTPTSAPNPA
ncbi:uncharacterized protein BXZ73DRAFT_99266 [Epithele typhae]|uniref:uncharacterized protein n=1 Tax=Epithele typhae TaxID=378194 RepID=UPI002007B66A|nr:uncharacterized protein BXZ73DRAFT_99266 [Epithele typhae]KAH9939652.1 hypothetical protein BXZ73DRAFT_99266 [Epithele typhae]